MRPPARVYAILARKSSKAIVFRRGPSQLVQAVLWDRDDDSFAPGQWFKGALYPERCDLSPSGRLLVCFTAKHRGAGANSITLSRPPWLTALARWPQDDAWSSGGIFGDERTLFLDPSTPAMRDLTGISVQIAEASGLVIRDIRDHPDYRRGQRCADLIRLRDGWLRRGSGPPDTEAQCPDYRDVFWEKPGPGGLCLNARHGRDGKLGYGLIGSGAAQPPEGEGWDWADWDGGDLVFSRGGCLWRLPRGETELAAARLLHDFNKATFAAIVAPPEALTW